MCRVLIVDDDDAILAGLHGQRLEIGSQICATDMVEDDIRAVLVSIIADCFLEFLVLIVDDEVDTKLCHPLELSCTPGWYLIVRSGDGSKIQTGSAVHPRNSPD